MQAYYYLDSANITITIIVCKHTIIVKLKFRKKYYKIIYLFLQYLEKA